MRPPKDGLTAKDAGEAPALLADKLGIFGIVSKEQLATLKQLIGGVTRVRKRVEIIRQGYHSEDIFILLSGWACRYKVLADGRRQIIHFLLPGDDFGIRCLFRRPALDTVGALTDAVIAHIPCEALAKVLQSSPELAFAVMSSMSQTEAIIVRRVSDLGRLSATERIVSLLVELAYRLKRLGLGTGDGSGYPCPLTQQDLADAVGLTSIHVNRVLRSLRESDLLIFEGGRLMLRDPHALTQLAHFDPPFAE